MKIPVTYKKLRATVPFDEVEMGYSSIALAPTNSLAQAQQGYGIVSKGQETDWREEWLVIGNEGRCGDPIFIDISDDEYPIYTAPNGMGTWEPQPIAYSFNHFIQILEKLRELSHGRSNPVALEKKPVTEKERVEFLAVVLNKGDDLDVGFWESFCGD